jgi:hypothetical protein
LKNTLVRNICGLCALVYVIEFDPIGIKPHLALQNHHQNLNFVKDIYIVGDKIARNDCKMANRKSCAFHFESESILHITVGF